MMDVASLFARTLDPQTYPPFVMKGRGWTPSETQKVLDALTWLPPRVDALFNQWQFSKHTSSPEISVTRVTWRWSTLVDDVDALIAFMEKNGARHLYERKES